MTSLRESALGPMCLFASNDIASCMRLQFDDKLLLIISQVGSYLSNPDKIGLQLICLLGFLVGTLVRRTTHAH